VASAKSTTPALRFKGFDVEWEEQKASKIFLTVADKGHPKLPVLSATQDRGMIKRIHTGININHDERNEITYKRVMPGQFVIHLRSFQGGLAHSTTEGITSPAYTVMDFIQKECQYDQYWKHIFNSEKFIKSLEAVTYGIRDGRSISFDDLSTLSFTYPDAIEQKKIGNYFQNLDSLIALQRRKLVKLQNVKKAMLQKMFPTRGSTTPQIRFAGFTEPWQEQKLGDISDVKTGPFGSTLHAGDYVSDGVAIITTEHFKNGELPEIKNDIPQVSKEDVRRLQSYVLNTDDIVFSRVGSVDINALITSHQNGWLFSGRVLRVRTNKAIDSQYLHYELSTERARNDVIGRAVGQTMPSINTEILKQTTVYLPTKIAEQIKIGIYFKHLDTRISLQQRKLEKLQNVKKACLAAMFV
jgi:type I restriction enzyme S subunit